jgi:hypothetical protein
MKISLSQIRALRSIRAGSSLNEVCRLAGMQKNTLREIELAYQNVSDQILGDIERVLREREKLRRLVADLLPNLPA